MVNEYLRQNCEYRLGSLKPQIFLLPKEGTAINYSIDNNTCEVRGINADTIYKMIGVSTRFEETSNEAGRFNYTSTVTFTMREQWGEPWMILMQQLRNGNYYVVFEDTMGVQYLQTPEFTSDISYQYTFDNSTNNGNTLEIYFRCDNNVPATILDFKVTETDILADNDCAYLGGRLENLRLCPQKYCYIEVEGDSKFTNIYTTNGETFKIVEPCTNNFQYRQQYRNGQFSDTVTFTIPLSDYKYYFHYSLEEFVKNRYAVVFETADGDNTIASGFEFGYFPEYTIQTSEEQMELNTITITLRHVGSQSFYYSSERGAHYIPDNTPSYARAGLVTDPSSGLELTDYACISETQAIITLLQILTSSGEPTGNYACLSGYESKYQHLNVTKIYSQSEDLGVELVFNSYDCAVQQDCRFVIPPPTSMSFGRNGQNRVVTIEATCDFVITGLPSWLTASPVTGLANTPTQVVFTCNQDPVEGEILKGTLITSSGILTRLTDVLLQPEASWIRPIVFDINASEQDAITNYYIPKSNIQLVDGGGISYVTISNNGTISMHVPQNNTSEARTFYVTFKRNDTNEQVIVTINQSGMYQQWIADESKYVCENGNSYVWEELWYGYTEDSFTIDSGQHRKGALIQENDDRCQSVMTEWRPTTETVCDGSDKWSIEEQYESSDGGTTWRKTGETRRGAVMETNSPDCDSTYFWQETGNTICRNGNLYKVLIKYHDTGTEIVSTGETKLGDLVEVQSASCIPDDQQIITYDFEFASATPNVDEYMLSIRASSAFQINWGDGTTTNYLLSDFTNLSRVYHQWNDTVQNLNGHYHVEIYGGISELVICKPSVMSNYYTTAIDVTKAPGLKVLIDRDSSKVDTLDLTNNNHLTKVGLASHVAEFGMKSFKWPTVNEIEHLYITCNENQVSHTTAVQLNKIITDAPTVTSGLMEFCYQNDVYGVNQVCDVDQAAALAKGWMVSKECCEVNGTVKYRKIAAENYICDEYDYTKYSYWTLEQSTFTNGSWSTWVPVEDVKIKNQPVEYNSTDCGYVPSTMYEWRLGTTWECDMETHISYYQEQLYESTDGSTWYPALPEQYRRSDTERKRDDEDCGYVPPGTYREEWFVVEGEYICGNDAENCNFQTLWVPLGYYFNETASGGVFNNKTIREIPDICNGTQIRVCIGTFQNMSYITSAPSFDTRNVTNMRQMFYGCTSLATVPQYNYANVEDISQMFYNCTSLTSDIDLSTATNLKVADNVFYRSGITSVVGLDANNLNMKGQYDTAWVIGGPNIETLHIDNLSNIILDVRTNTSLTNESFEYLFMHSASTAKRTTWIWVSQEQWDLQIYPNNYFELANERYNVNFTTSKPNV